MSENHSGGGAGLQIGLLLAGAFMLALIFAMWQIGTSTLRTLGLILVGAIALALVIGASALPIRAWRRKDFTGDHYHSDGTKTIVKEVRVIDGRQVTAPEVKLLQLPAQPQAGAYPELLRAAYQAGATTLPARSASRWQPDPGDYSETNIEEVDLTSPEGWNGDITG